jgi:hypothetical protein
MENVARLRKGSKDQRSPKDRKLSPLNPANLQSRSFIKFGGGSNPTPKLPKLYYYSSLSCPDLTAVWRKPPENENIFEPKPPNISKSSNYDYKTQKVFENPTYEESFTGVDSDNIDSDIGEEVSEFKSQKTTIEKTCIH